MKTLNRTLSILLTLVLFVTIVGCDLDYDDSDMKPIMKPDLMFYGLTPSNQLVAFNANDSQYPISTIDITGLSSGEYILAIDFRPATGQLYGVGSTSRIYIINHNTGAATPLGAAPFTPAIDGSMVGFDFNPTVDRIRLVTSSGQNLRLNPETGAVASTDGMINPGPPAIGAVAYTNSFAGSTTTTLFDIDLAELKLFRQDPPNDGTLVEVGSLNINGMAASEGGFDISAENNIALAALSDGSGSTLYQVDLTSGKAVDLGKIPMPIIGLAIPTLPIAYAIDPSNNLQIFNFESGGTPISKPITGLNAGDTILGIDLRPATGQLYALGRSSRIYTINMASGAAAAVGNPFSTALSGTSFGFDFNPTVDRIRVVSNTGQNLRLNPITGEVAAVDMALNPGQPAVSAVAYTNNFPGATTTTLFDIDYLTDKLYIQNPPNNGTLVEVGSLGIDADAANGFDIGGTSNKAYGLITSGGQTKIYSINMMTGAATPLSNYPNAVRGFTIGLGF